MKIVPFKPAKDEYAEEAANLLDRLAQEAREGKIAAVAIGIVRPDGLVASAISASEKASLLLGACTYVQHRLMMMMDDQAEDET